MGNDWKSVLNDLIPKACKHHGLCILSSICEALPEQMSPYSPVNIVMTG
jgi:hypothetical protein